MKSELKQPDPTYPDTILTLSKDEVYKLKRELMTKMNTYLGNGRDHTLILNLIDELDRAQRRYR